MDNIISIEKLFNAPIQKVWLALTNKDEMKKWYFDLKEFKPEVGFKFGFTGGPSPEKQYNHLCEITELIPEKKLTHSWRYEGYPGNSFVTWQLEQKNDQTLLKLTHRGIDTFSNQNPDFAISNFEAGWDDIVNNSLRKYLEES